MGNTSNAGLNFEGAKTMYTKTRGSEDLFFGIMGALFLCKKIYSYLVTSLQVRVWRPLPQL